MIKLVKISVTGVRNDEILSLVDEIMKLEGVIKSSANVDNALIEVKYDSLLVHFNFIKDYIEDTGCQVV